MSDSPIIHRPNSSHNVPDLSRDLATLPTPESSLVTWAERYLHAKVLGIQSPNTVDAKRRDLKTFMEFFAEVNHHLLIEEWLARDTRAFLKRLEKLGRAPGTINRALRTLSHFAGWVHQQPGTPFARMGMPTAGIKELAIDEPDAKKLEKAQVWALFRAADRLVLTQSRANARPKRNRAILALFYYTGVRVTELAHLKLSQWDGRRFKEVRRKGGLTTRVVYVAPEGRRALEAYLAEERPQDEQPGADSFFLPSVGSGPLTRRQLHTILVRVAQEATKHGGAIHLHAHRLRHTFAWEIRALTKSDGETARMLGHQSERYVSRYSRSSQAEREQMLDGLEVGLD